MKPNGPHRRLSRRLRSFAAAVLVAASGGAADLSPRHVDADGSLMAVITRKAGFASGRAHEHLIAVGEHELMLSLDPEHPGSARFELVAAARDLIVDDPADRGRWSGPLLAAGALDEAFTEVEEEQREKIRKQMLSPKQLDAGRFPTVEVALLSAEPQPASGGWPWRLHLRLSVHGSSREIAAKGRLEPLAEAAGFHLEAVGEARFTDFGIEPYSAFLGAVKNEDRFFLYLSLRLLGAQNAD